MISREEVREKLTGPIASLTTPFTRDGEIDYPGLRKLIDGNLEGGSNSSLLTYGDSLFSLMTDDEIAEVTRVVAEHTGTRGLTVAADGGWWTGKTVEFARYCREVGVDVLMVKPPIWGASGTVETSVEHYAAVAAEIPVMLVTNIWANDTAKGLRTIEVLLDKVDGDSGHQGRYPGRIRPQDDGDGPGQLGGIRRRPEAEPPRYSPLRRDRLHVDVRIVLFPRDT